METSQNPVNDMVLHKLRDIHLPDPVSFYPLPMAWWIMITVVILLSIGLWLLVQYRLKAAQRTALKKLDQLETELASHDNQAVIFMELSYLLKHYVKNQYPNSLASGLIGDDWLNFLDRTSHSKEFSQGAGKTLRTLPYQNNKRSSLEVFSAVRLWIKQNPYKTKKHIVL